MSSMPLYIQGEFVLNKNNNLVIDRMKKREDEIVLEHHHYDFSFVGMKTRSYID
jgi:hypothetical protein